MHIVEKPQGSPLHLLDYAKIAKNYNSLAIGGAVVMDKVYNITSFKAALARRGVTVNVDFQAYNVRGETLVKRLTSTRMEG